MYMRSPMSPVVHKLQRRVSLNCVNSSTETIEAEPETGTEIQVNESDNGGDIAADSITGDIGTTSSLLTELFAELHSSKAARDTVEKTKMAQIYDTMSGIETELNAGIKRMQDEVR